MSAGKRGAARATGPKRNTHQPRSSDLSDRAAAHGRVARAALTKIVRAPASSFVTLFVIAVSLLLPALLFGLNSNLANVLSNFQESAQVSLYLRGGTSDAEAIEVSDNLLTSEAIRDVRYVSPERALEEFGSTTGLQSLLQGLGSNPLPGTLLVAPADSQPSAVEALVAELQGIAEVELVQVDGLWLERLAAISDLIRSVGRIFSVVVVLGLFFIVGNTIKLAVENQKAEIRVIKLVGGDDLFAARPFLYLGLFYGIGGGLLATVLQAIVLAAFSSNLDALMRLYESDFTLQGFSLSTALVVTSSGAAIGWIAALLASLRHIRSIDP